MYSNIHIPTISDYIATSLTDASTSHITLNAGADQASILTDAQQILKTLSEGSESMHSQEIF